MTPTREIRIRDVRRTGSSLAYNIVDGENTSPPPQLSPPPVLITSINNLDDVTTFERELPRVCGLEGMQRSHASDQYRRCGVYRTNKLFGGLLNGGGVGLNMNLRRDCGCWDVSRFNRWGAVWLGRRLALTLSGSSGRGQSVI